tara:strand:+ start:1071 stop:1346 length:276 start_codon:yes stop_codon:yes gene_type:complete
MVSAKRRQQLRQQVKPWNDHVAKVKAANPNLEYKEVLKKAKRSYKKGKPGSSKPSSSWKGFSKYEIRRKPKRSSSKKKSKKRTRSSIGWFH